MPLDKQRQPLSRRRPLHCVAGTPMGKKAQPRSVGAFLSGLAVRRHTLSVAAIQASIKSPDRLDATLARAENLESMLSLLGKVQSYGGHKDICLFPVVPLPDDALPVLLQAARRYNCTIVYGSEGLARNGGILRLTTTVPPNGEIRIDHTTSIDVVVLKLRTRNGIYWAVACAADAWYPSQTGLTTAIHSPDGRAIVATRSRGEQVITAVLHVADLAG